MGGKFCGNVHKVSDGRCGNGSTPSSWDGERFLKPPSAIVWKASDDLAAASKLGSGRETGPVDCTAGRTACKSIGETVGEERTGRGPGAPPNDGMVVGTSDGMVEDASDRTVDESVDRTSSEALGASINGLAGGAGMTVGAGTSCETFTGVSCESLDDPISETYCGTIEGSLDKARSVPKPAASLTAPMATAVVFSLHSPSE